MEEIRYKVGEMQSFMYDLYTKDASDKLVAARQAASEAKYEAGKENDRLLKIELRTLGGKTALSNFWTRFYHANEIYNQTREEAANAYANDPIVKKAQLYWQCVNE